MELDYDGEDIVDMPKKPKEIKLKDVYEPSEISEKMLTENDELIRVRDVPERFQNRTETNIDVASLTREAESMARQLLRDRTETPEKTMVKTVLAILRLLKIDLLEVPFIYAHRKDYFDGILRHYDLWRIVDLDAKFTLAESKKLSLMKIIEAIARLNPSIISSPLPGLVDKIGSLDDAGDVSQYIQIQYPIEMEAIQIEKQSNRLKFKRAPWKIMYDDAIHNNIEEFAKLLDIKMFEYVQSLTMQQKLHYPTDSQLSPLDSAVPFLCARFSTPQSVLGAAKILLGHQLASHPVFRAFIRRVYYTDAIVSVTLTAKGKKEIEPTHPYYPFKYLQNKPVYNFKDGQFLQILDAEAKGLLTITVRVDQEKNLLEDITKQICNDDVNENAVKWNNERSVISMYAAKEILFPHAAKWLKEQLAIQACDFVSSFCLVEMEKVLFA